jgi:hypothetical protein
MKDQCWNISFLSTRRFYLGFLKHYLKSLNPNLENHWSQYRLRLFTLNSTPNTIFYRKCEWADAFMCQSKTSEKCCGCDDEKLVSSFPTKK